MTCIHHWVLETPEGSKIKGRCKLCAEERDFETSWRWDRGGPLPSDPLYMRPITLERRQDA